MVKRILITGGAGFVGHHFVDYLLTHTDYEIISLDNLSYAGDLNRLDYIAKHNKNFTSSRLRVVYHDLKSPLNGRHITENGKVDYIMHMAAGSHVDRSIQNPMDFVLNNVVGTVNLLEYARNIDSLETFIYFSTYEVFGP